MGELIKYELGQWERLKSLALDSVTSPQCGDWSLRPQTMASYLPISLLASPR
jgi:hypothetical protein